MSKLSEVWHKTTLADHGKEPGPDMGECSECGWKGPLKDCPMEDDGDYESGYYQVPVCPKCDDGGCLDRYDYSPEQEAALRLFHAKRLKNK